MVLAKQYTDDETGRPFRFAFDGLDDSTYTLEKIIQAGGGRMVQCWDSPDVYIVSAALISYIQLGTRDLSDVFPMKSVFSSGTFIHVRHFMEDEQDLVPRAVGILQWAGPWRITNGTDLKALIRCNEGLERRESEQREFKARYQEVVKDRKRLRLEGIHYGVTEENRRRMNIAHQQRQIDQLTRRQVVFRQPAPPPPPQASGSATANAPMPTPPMTPSLAMPPPPPRVPARLSAPGVVTSAGGSQSAEPAASVTTESGSAQQIRKPETHVGHRPTAQRYSASEPQRSAADHRSASSSYTTSMRLLSAEVQEENPRSRPGHTLEGQQSSSGATSAKVGEASKATASSSTYYASTALAPSNFTLQAPQAIHGQVTKVQSVTTRQNEATAPILVNDDDDPIILRHVGRPRSESARHTEVQLVTDYQPPAGAAGRTKMFKPLQFLLHFGASPTRFPQALASLKSVNRARKRHEGLWVNTVGPGQLPQVRVGGKTIPYPLNPDLHTIVVIYDISARRLDLSEFINKGMSCVKPSWVEACDTAQRLVCMRPYTAGAKIMAERALPTPEPSSPPDSLSDEEVDELDSTDGERSPQRSHASNSVKSTSYDTDSYDSDSTVDNDDDVDYAGNSAVIPSARRRSGRVRTSKRARLQPEVVITRNATRGAASKKGKGGKKQSAAKGKSKASSQSTAGSSQASGPSCQCSVCVLPVSTESGCRCYVCRLPQAKLEVE